MIFKSAILVQHWQHAKFSVTITSQLEGAWICHCEKRSDEAISDFASQHENGDCFAPLAITFLGSL